MTQDRIRAIVNAVHSATRIVANTRVADAHADQWQHVEVQLPSLLQRDSSTMAVEVAERMRYSTVPVTVTVLHAVFLG